jgi:hypothetical protein
VAAFDIAALLWKNCTFGRCERCVTCTASREATDGAKTDVLALSATRRQIYMELGGNERCTAERTLTPERVFCSASLTVRSIRCTRSSQAFCFEGSRAIDVANAVERAAVPTSTRERRSSIGSNRCFEADIARPRVAKPGGAVLANGAPMMIAPAVRATSEGRSRGGARSCAAACGADTRSASERLPDVRDAAYFIAAAGEDRSGRAARSASSHGRPGYGTAIGRSCRRRRSDPLGTSSER